MGQGSGGSHLPTLLCFWLRLEPQSSGLRARVGVRVGVEVGGAPETLASLAGGWPGAEASLAPRPPPGLSRLCCPGQGHEAAAPALRGPSPFPLPQNVTVGISLPSTFNSAVGKAGEHKINNQKTSARQAPQLHCDS